MNIVNGRLQSARFIASPFFDTRPTNSQISLLVIHNISLPPNRFGGGYIDQLFTGTLNPHEHAYFAQIHQMRVSAHNLISRDGSITQYVSYLDRAWHAGVSSFQGQDKCNDFSIGVEMEGGDLIPYTDQQYDALVYLTQQITQAYPAINMSRIVGHNDIAPGRKTDPGVAFNWARFRTELQNKKVSK